MKYQTTFVLFFACAVAGFHVSLNATVAADDDHAKVEFFESNIRPVLVEHCYKCHSQQAKNVRGGLLLDSQAGVAQGGESGPAIVSGKPEDSLLLSSLKHESYEMPPDRKLPDNVIADFEKWITDGAIDPRAGGKTLVRESIDLEAGRNFWCFQPVTKPEIPTATDVAWSRTPIDRFIAARHRQNNVSPVQDASPEQIVRRLYFTLIGLPPNIAQISEFVDAWKIDSDKAIADTADLLLASPRFGERWGRHWLDATRFAESSGGGRSLMFKDAWRFRDYVIQSFNNDKPFDQLIREHIAGDLLPSTSAAQFDDQVTGVGYLTLGPTNYEQQDKELLRMEVVDEQVDTIGRTFLAMTLGCARCHDHKFDPVPTRDYYSIQAVFATTQLAERSAKFLPQENTTGFDEQLYLQKAKKQYSDSRKNLDDALVANAATWWTQKHGADNKEWQTAVEQATGKNDVFKAAIKVLQAKGFDESELPSKLDCYTPEQFGQERVVRKGLQRLAWEFDRYLPFALSVYNGHTPQVTSVTMPMRLPANTSKGELETSYILTGGDPFTHGEIVRPGILSVVAQQADAHVPDAISGRRLAFANWVADEGNPLTARVIVNRIWQWHFGKAIAGNANNFGSTGARPTHPALLDWLAATFVEGGWSVKSITKQIMLSDAYCRSSDWPVEAAVTADQHELAARLYAVFEPRRLSAEELRDAMLKVTGELNPVLGGIPCRPEINQEVALQPRQVMGSFASAWIPNPQPERRNRRSVYVLKLRGLVDPMLEVFNAPSPDFSCERRESSTVTPQVFSLFNSTNSHARALALANRVVEETANDSDAVTLCFQLALSRNPTAAERQEVLAHWQAMIKQQPEQAAELEPQPLKVVRKAVEENTGENFAFEETLFSNADYVPDLQPIDCDRRTRALADVCLVILNSNEFVYVY